MFWTRLIISAIEFGLSVVLSIFIVFWSYKSFVEISASYDVEDELKKGNVAVATLLTSLMVGASWIMQKAVYPVTSSISLYMTSPAEDAVPLWKLIAYCLGHLVFSFLVTVATIELALRTFEKLCTEIDEQEEVRKGNAAVAIVMAGVVLVTSSYLQEGVSALSKALIPRPALGQMRVFR